MTIENGTLRVSWTATTHRVSVLYRASHREFIKNLALHGDNVTVQVLPIVRDKRLGRGQALRISYTNGDYDSIELYRHLPFVLFRSTLSNSSQTNRLVRSLRPFSCVVKLGKPAAELTTLGTGGLLPPNKNPGSYDWLTVAEPHSRHGVVFGWITHRRGDGVLFSHMRDGAVRVDGQIDFGRLGIQSGQSTELETLAVGYFDDARLGLEAWPDAVAKVQDIHLPPQPVVYCTWYSRPYGAASDEKHLAENAAFAATNLAPFGLSVIQIDDHWQAGISTNGPHRDFTRSNPKGPYPHGMKATAKHLKLLGLKPGLWFMPFAGTYYDPHFAVHSDWFVKRKDGKPYEVRWGGTCLDMTDPGARDYVSNVVDRIAHKWGFEYFKIDGLWTGTATPLEYVNTGYKNDHIGDAVFHKPNVPNIQAFRSGLKLVRKAADLHVFILGCNGPQNMRSYGAAMGLVDGMRIGPDNNATWPRLMRGPRFGSRQYFLNGRVWYNDPDPLYVRPSVPLNEARLICSWVTISGELNTSSEWYPGLPASRLDLLKRTMPSHGLLSTRPVDLFEHDPPRLWLLTDARHQPRRDVIGVFNWSDQPEQFDVPLARIGLGSNTTYHGFEYWQNKLLPLMKGRLRIRVPARSARVVAVRPVAEHPQLISTSRHITQGIVDVVAEKWHAATSTLSGRSKLVGGNPYELRIVTRRSARGIRLSTDDRKAGVKARQVSQKGELLRARIESPISREVAWRVVFH